MKRLFILLFILTIIVSAHSKETLEKGNIIVTVTNIKNTNGYVKIALMNKEKQFKEKNYFRKAKAKIVNNTSIYTFKNIPHGEYVISCFHDEDNDNKIKTNFIGIPKEGVGLSNNPKMKFGPPKFKDGVFILKNKNKQIKISLVYID